jgi:Tfp pilus assembly protein PilF
MMRPIRCALTLAGTVWLLSACQSTVVQEFPLTHLKAEHLLDSGVRQYDEGNYKIASRNIQNALDAGLTTRSRARAHKYLAFMACVSGQQSQCREEFRQALLISPTMELKPEEAGHPTWGPVFRSVKVSMSTK